MLCEQMQGLVAHPSKSVIRCHRERRFWWPVIAFIDFICFIPAAAWFEGAIGVAWWPVVFAIALLPVPIGAKNRRCRAFS
jgi:hypothetical protein